MNLISNFILRPGVATKCLNYALRFQYNSEIDLGFFECTSDPFLWGNSAVVQSKTMSIIHMKLGSNEGSG